MTSPADVAHSADALDAVERLVVDESPRPLSAGQRVLVVDSPAVARHAVDVGASVWGFCDSAVDHASLPEPVTRVHPDEDLPPLDLALGRLPRDLDALDELAAWVAPSGAALGLAARTKHMTPTMNPVLARHFTTVEASRGRDKSRVLRAQGSRENDPRSWPRTRRVEVAGRALEIVHHGAAFASGRLDAGTRLMTDHIDQITAPGPRRVLDWGSGAGLITLALADRLPDAELVAVDLSWAGAASTRASLARAGVPADVRWDDGNRVLAEADPFDLIVSNPPFHDGAAKSSGATLTMIDLAADRLAPGGELWLVFNSHLPWLTHMRRHGRAEVVAQNRGYTLARLSRPGRPRAYAGLVSDHSALDDALAGLPGGTDSDQTTRRVLIGPDTPPAGLTAARQHAWGWSVDGEPDQDIPFTDHAEITGRLATEAPRLLVMDVDSTLTTSEAIDLLAQAAGAGERVAEITERAMRGELDFAQSLAERVATLAGLDARVLDDVRQQISFSPGAVDLVRTVHDSGAQVGVVSGGFVEIVAPLVAPLDIEHVAANRLEVVDGRLTGRTVGEVVDRAAKERHLRAFAQAAGAPLELTVAIGDGANDLDMLAAAGLGIAYCAKPVTAEQARATISFPRLDAALGYLVLP